MVAMTRGLSSSCLQDLTVWVVPPPEDGAVPRPVLGVRESQRGALVRLSGITDVGRAHEIVGGWLMAPGDVLPPEPAAAADEIGYRVGDVRHGDLGVVTDIIITGANDVLVVDEGPYGQIMVPVIEEVILGIDDGSRTISVRLLPGLVEGLE